MSFDFDSDKDRRKEAWKIMLGIIDELSKRNISLGDVYQYLVFLESQFRKWYKETGIGVYNKLRKITEEMELNTYYIIKEVPECKKKWNLLCNYKWVTKNRDLIKEMERLLGV